MAGKVDYKEVENFVNAQGLHIFCKYWNPSGSDPSALVFIAHGAAEHCLWYEQVAQSLTKRNLMVFAHDHVGHGQSEGDRVHIDDFDKYINDVFRHTNMMKKKYPEKPVFIIGHSMGGAIAIRAAMKSPDYFKGIVLIGPAVIANPETATPFRTFLARCVAWISPQFGIHPIEPQWTCRDVKMVKKYEEDPLNYHGGLKARWAVCLLDALDYITKNMATITWPFLILHGDQDKLCLLDGSRQLMEKSISSDKTMKVYEGAYHQLHNEPDGLGETVIQEMTDWITNRV